MDLGIQGRKAFVSASSQGLGFACARALAAEGVHVTLNGRDPARLAAAANDLRAIVPGAAVAAVCADLTTEEGRACILEACSDVDILINNNAGPPPSRMEDWNLDTLEVVLRANMIPGVLLMRGMVPGMRQRKFGRIVNITSAVVKQPPYILALSSGARSALTAVAKAISMEVAVDNVTVNNLLPERIDTPRQAFMAKRMMAEHDIDVHEARRRIADTIAAKRMGRPEEFGAACAFLCSAQASYISGQNLQLDGGSYPGLV